MLSYSFNAYLPLLVYCYRNPGGIQLEAELY